MYKKLDILELFLRAPAETFHVRDVARKCEIAASTAGYKLKRYAEQGMLTVTEKYRHKLYQANVESDHFRDFRLYFIIRTLRQSGLVKDLHRYYRNATVVLVSLEDSADHLVPELVVLSNQRYTYPRKEYYERKMDLQVAISVKKNVEQCREQVLNGVVLAGRIA